MNDSLRLMRLGDAQHLVSMLRTLRTTNAERLAGTGIRGAEELLVILATAEDQAKEILRRLQKASADQYPA